MKEKIYKFIYDYEEIIQYMILMILVVFIMCFIVFKYDKALTQEKNIIENTKDYTIFTNCKRIGNDFYCWNEEK